MRFGDAVAILKGDERAGCSPNAAISAGIGSGVGVISDVLNGERRVLGDELFHKLRRIVGGGVIDYDDFEVVVGLFRQSVKAAFEQIAPVACRYYNRYEWGDSVSWRWVMAHKRGGIIRFSPRVWAEISCFFAEQSRIGT